MFKSLERVVEFLPEQATQACAFDSGAFDDVNVAQCVAREAFALGASILHRHYGITGRMVPPSMAPCAAGAIRRGYAVWGPSFGDELIWAEAFVGRGTMGPLYRQNPLQGGGAAAAALWRHRDVRPRNHSDAQPPTARHGLRRG